MSPRPRSSGGASALRFAPLSCIVTCADGTEADAADVSCDDPEDALSPADAEACPDPEAEPVEAETEPVSDEADAAEAVTPSGTDELPVAAVAVGCSGEMAVARAPGSRQ